jgi:RNA polymerase sigma-70 factor (ECF subfamily)
MQQTLLHIHRARGSFIPGAPVIPWAFAIARRLIVDTARRHQVERRIFADTPPEDEYLPRESIAPTADELLHARRLEDRVRERFDSLPEVQRTAYQLLHGEGMTLKGAAEALGTSVSAVKLRAHRAYQALRAALREKGDPS